MINKKIKTDVINNVLTVETINNYFSQMGYDILIENLGEQKDKGQFVLYNVYVINNNNNTYNYPEYKNLYNNMIIIHNDGSILLLF
jgi:hypothetical protein